MIIIIIIIITMITITQSLNYSIKNRLISQSSKNFSKKMMREVVNQTID